MTEAIQTAVCRVAEMLSLTTPLVWFDLETTGTNPKTDRIVEFAGVKWYPSGSVSEFRTLINPGIPIPAEASHGDGRGYEGHGITDADVATAPTFQEMGPKIVRSLEGAVLGGFNAKRFDVPLLATECDRIGLAFDFKSFQVVDAYQAWIAVERRDLGAFVAKYCGESHDGAHSAAADVSGSIRGFVGLLEAFQELPREVAALAVLGDRPKDPNAFDDDGKIVWRDGAARFTFGKYDGQPLTAADTGYLDYMERKDFDPVVVALVRAAVLHGEVPQGPPVRP